MRVALVTLILLALTGEDARAETPTVPSVQRVRRKRSRIEVCGPLIQGARHRGEVLIIEAPRPEFRPLLRTRRDFRDRLAPSLD